jgi:hypothetical protein
MFHNWAIVRRHIAATKPCREANMGIREILLEALAGNVMAGGGGAAGPALDVRHQPAGDVQAKIRNNKLQPCKTKLEHQHSWSSGQDSLAVCMRFRVRIPDILSKCFVRAYTRIYRHIPTCTSPSFCPDGKDIMESVESNRLQAKHTPLTKYAHVYMRKSSLM